MEEGGEKGQSLEEQRKNLFRQQAEQMLIKGKEKDLKPPKPDEQWIQEYVGAMEGLHKLITEINKDLIPRPVSVGHFDSRGLTVDSVDLAWSAQKSPTENIGSVPLVVPPKELPKT